MANRFKSDLTWGDVTPENVFLNRRAFMAGASALAATGIVGPALASQYSTKETPNAWDEITQYNNFYEFGTGKTDPAEYASALTTDPWEVQIDGLVDKPGAYSFKDIMDAMTIEERIYRFRCVEAWSMVIPPTVSTSSSHGTGRSRTPSIADGCAMAERLQAEHGTDWC